MGGSGQGDGWRATTAPGCAHSFPPGGRRGSFSPWTPTAWTGRASVSVLWMKQQVGRELVPLCDQGTAPPPGRGRGRDSALLAVKRTHRPARLVDSQEDLGRDQPCRPAPRDTVRWHGGCCPLHTDLRDLSPVPGSSANHQRQTDRHTLTHTDTHTEGQVSLLERKGAVTSPAVATSRSPVFPDPAREQGRPRHLPCAHLPASPASAWGFPGWGAQTPRGQGRVSGGQLFFRNHIYLNISRWSNQPVRYTICNSDWKFCF